MMVYVSCGIFIDLVINYKLAEIIQGKSRLEAFLVIFYAGTSRTRKYWGVYTGFRPTFGGILTN